MRGIVNPDKRIALPAAAARGRCGGARASLSRASVRRAISVLPLRSLAPGVLLVPA
jgi:hypothetical protein